VEVHRSRYELERILSRYGSDEVRFVEAESNTAILLAPQFDAGKKQGKRRPRAPKAVNWLLGGSGQGQGNGGK
jgi:hypothetical protein